MEQYCVKELGNDAAAVPPQAQAVLPLDAWQEFIADYEEKLADGKTTFTWNPAQQSVHEEYSH